MTLDTAPQAIDLVAWRDAAIRGELPEPHRSDRWVPLRAGLVNLWEYDVAEIWYADGRLQLQGANESGKSTLMTLTTLLLLAGDVSGHNIDTLGESGKRFRYYIEPTNLPLDRRDPSAAKQRGWAWVEYGRITREGPRFFTCMLFSEARRADKNLKLAWCTVSGEQRVRRGVSLANAGFVAEPSHLRDTPGFTEHRSGTAYREEIARRLFETEPGWLDQLIRILRVVRTPKIGDRLDLTFLTKAFRSALPPLAEDEINQLADGWEQLERLRTERDVTEQALAAVSDFTRRSWRPWADAVIRAAADPVATATSALTGITRNETAAKETVATLGSQLEGLDERIAGEDTQQATAVAERDALRERQEYKDAISAMQNARQLAERATDLENLASRSEQRAVSSQAAIAPAELRLSKAREQLTGAEERVDSAAGQVAGHAEAAGLVDATARFLPERDTARLRQAAVRRDEASQHALRLLAEQTSAAENAERATARTGEARERLDQTRNQIEQAITGLDTAINAAADVLIDWVAGLDVRIRPTTSLVEHWADQVAGLVDAERPDPVLGGAITRDHLTPSRRPIEQRKVELTNELAVTASAKEAVERELAAVEADTDPRPELPALWRRRDRPEGVTSQGAPFWRLVEVDGVFDTEAVAGLEAVLDAAGLLQAWITPDGRYVLDRDGQDTVWIAEADAPRSGTLCDLLRAADDAGPLAATVDRLLRTVAYGPTLPDAGTGVGADGRWRHGELSGFAAPTDAGPRLLGAAARAADRARRIADLRGRLAALDERRTTLDAELADVDGLLAALDRAADPLPSDLLVVRAVLTLRTAETDLEAAEENVRIAKEAEQEALTALSVASSAVASHADAHGLPRTRDEVEDVRTATAEYVGAVRDLASALTLPPPLREAVQQAEETLEDCADAAAQATLDAEKDRKQATNARARADAAQAVLSQEGQSVLVRFTALGTRIQRHEETLRRLNEERAELHTRFIRADDNLKQVEERRRDAEAQRQIAIDGWFRCVDSCLPKLRDIPDPTARHLTGALESARTARARISPRDWPENDQGAALQRVQNLWGRLVDAVAHLRSQLEPLAGRTARTVPPGDGDDWSPGAVEVTVDGTGAAQPPPTAVNTLSGLLARLQTDYDEELTRTIDQLLGSTFIEHLRDRLVEAEQLRTDINAKLAQNPTSTSGLMLQLVRQAVAEESAANQVLDALERSFKLLPDSTQEQVRQFLATRIGDAQEAARAAGDPDWRTRLGEILDYRQWFELKLEYRTPHTDSGPPKWHKLDRDNHALLSGGAKVVTLLQPFVAALHAMYDQSGVGPRMMWLDEAFDGVDPDNRATMLRLLTSCDLDWLIAGPGPIANAATVPVASIYEVRRAPRPFPGVSLELAVWSGNGLTHIATPDPADLPNLDRSAAQSAPTDDDLFSAQTS